ncbi:hypothetical protein HDU96_002465, partial [Phlyctochytrium bullatum]
MSTGRRTVQDTVEDARDAQEQALGRVARAEERLDAAHASMREWKALLIRYIDQHLSDFENRPGFDELKEQLNAARADLERARGELENARKEAEARGAELKALVAELSEVRKYHLRYKCLDAIQDARDAQEQALGRVARAEERLDAAHASMREWKALLIRYIEQHLADFATHPVYQELKEQLNAARVDLERARGELENARKEAEARGAKLSGARKDYLRFRSQR